MAIRVLLLTQWFDPEPGFKGLVFARELRRLGLDVEVLTGFPNYPGGRIYPGYRLRLRQRETMDGVPVTRVPLFPSHDNSALRRITNYVSFAAAAVIQGLFFTRRPDVIYAYHPPLTVGIAAVVVGKLRRVPLLYDIQDIWPDTLRATGMIKSRRLLRFIEHVCNWVYRRVNFITVLSPGFERLLVSRGVPSAKLDVIPNWCDEAALAHVPQGIPAAFAGRDRFNILFAGNMGRAQSLGAVLSAAALLQSSAPAIRFLLLGGGVEVETLRRDCNERGLVNVEFLPAVPMSQVAAYLNAADALLVHLRDDALFRITIPSKTQAYMAVGKPLLMAVEGDAAELVRESGCGLTARPEDPASIAEAALALYRMGDRERSEMGLAGKLFYAQRLSLTTGAKRFADHFARLAEHRGTGRF
jgi:glycosyltransferase involved in cell wall biosynthesis